MDLLIKICGMRDSESIRQVGLLEADFMGFIFYSKSPRYVDDSVELIISNMPPSIKKTGVFVNESEDMIMQIVKKHELHAVQLHGNESANLCKSLKDKGLVVIKAFSIFSKDDFKQTQAYERMVDYFLFDTKTPNYGGSGLQFDWNTLEAYVGVTPFFLSGGIGADDMGAIARIKHPKFTGVDLNSKFETSPGIKDYDLLNSFITKIRNHESHS
ncbi:MAG: phosphoribosylanthranilate isomerase [Paludibacter sp.]|nr:phosphoribosylanthranilate isomerase [Paludibacter sp.]